MVPNADGLLDLTHLGETGEDDPIPNPFRLRYHPAAEVREVRLEIGSVLVGGRAGDASAIVNGQVVSPGDSLEGLKVASIDGDALSSSATASGSGCRSETGPSRSGSPAPEGPA